MKEIKGLTQSFKLHSSLETPSDVAAGPPDSEGAGFIKASRLIEPCSEVVTSSDVAAGPSGSEEVGFVKASRLVKLCDKVIPEGDKTSFVAASRLLPLPGSTTGATPTADSPKEEGTTPPLGGPVNGGVAKITKYFKGTTAKEPVTLKESSSKSTTSLQVCYPLRKGKH